MSVNKKDYSILENLVKNKGFKEKLLTKRIASFFRSTDYTYYLEEKNNIHDELMSIEDDEYNNGYTRGRLEGYNDGYKDAAEGFDYNPQNNDEYDEDTDNEDE